MLADTSEPKPTPTQLQRKRPVGYKHLSDHDLGIILKLTKDGRPQKYIALALGVSQAAVSLALARLGSDTVELAQHHLRSKAYPSARRLTHIAEKGRDEVAVRAAKVVLEGSGVITTTSTVQLGVMVQLGGSTVPALDTSVVGVIVDGNMETSASIE